MWCCTLQRAQGRVFSPLVTRVQPWGGTRHEWLCPPCSLQGWDLVPGHGVEQHPALGQGTGGGAEPASGPCGSAEGFAEEKHRCTHGLSTVTAFQGTDSAALNSIPI